SPLFTYTTLFRDLLLDAGHRRFPPRGPLPVPTQGAAPRFTQGPEPAPRCPGRPSRANLRCAGRPDARTSPDDRIRDPPALPLPDLQRPALRGARRPVDPHARPA